VPQNLWQPFRFQSISVLPIQHGHTAFLKTSGNPNCLELPLLFHAPIVGNLILSLNLHNLQRLHIAISKTDADEINTRRQIHDLQVFRVHYASWDIHPVQNAAVGS